MRGFPISFLFLTLLGVSVAAAAPRGEAPPPPPMDNATDADAPEPEITITTRDGNTFEEYRINGQLYRVKVTPKHGRPYYLLYDEQGRSRRSELEPDITVPSWVIKQF